MHHGIIYITLTTLTIQDSSIGFYYTPPDGITRCLLGVTNSTKVRKIELTTLLFDFTKDDALITYRELIGSPTLFKLALFRYETLNIPPVIEMYSFGNLITYDKQLSAVAAFELRIKSKQHQNWLQFFTRAPVETLLQKST